MLRLKLITSCLFLLTSLTALSSSDSVEVKDPLTNYLINLGYPSNEYQHSFNRDLLVQRESQLEGWISGLNQAEKIVDNYLGYLKWREFQRTLNSGFPPSRPIEEKLDEIRGTEIYTELINFPKGGNTHTHEDHELSKRTLLEIVWASVDFPYLYMNSPSATSNPYKLDFFIEPPSAEWIRVQNSSYTIDTLLPFNTLIGLLTPDISRYPTDTAQRWALINQLWGRCASSLISNINIKPLYLTAMFEHGYDEGVTYFETRRNLGGDTCIYRLNPDPKFSSSYGKECLNSDGTLEILLAEEVAKNFSVTHPNFIGHKRISYTTRRSSHQTFQQNMDATYQLYLKYPEHVLGFDAVGEEDAGRSSLYYISEYLSLDNPASNSSAMPLYLHTAETNWPMDLMSSTSEGDLLPTLENVFETILLRSKRVGHGGGFDKYPFLIAMLKLRNVAVEICPVSNQILGFNADLRTHQGHGFYRLGLPIVLGPDDPGTMGYDDFTVDWYAVFISWGLDLADLRQLALNSLNYSGMTPTEKDFALSRKWWPSWNAYIDQLKIKACSRDYVSEAIEEGRNISFSRIFPKEGALTDPTKVHIFGQNFENAICKYPTCKFGEKTVNATYISNQHLTCYSPYCANCTSNSVSVTVSIDGTTYLPTGYNFTYKYATLTPPSMLKNRRK